MVTTPWPVDHCTSCAGQASPQRMDTTIVGNSSPCTFDRNSSKTPKLRSVSDTLFSPTTTTTHTHTHRLEIRQYRASSHSFFTHIHSFTHSLDGPSLSYRFSATTRSISAATNVGHLPTSFHYYTNIKISFRSAHESHSNIPGGINSTTTTK